uniref:Uncharacterized protein n=1 Tax=Anguilla anguilla TaxID=7936 RepID=A0A0E9QGP9_ANGAN
MGTQPFIIPLSTDM